MSGIIASGTMPSALVVLGAAGAIGAGVVDAALESGRAVVAVGLDAAAHEALRARHPAARLVVADAAITSDAAAAALAAGLREGGIVVDGVVASLAGTHRCGRLIDEPADLLRRTLDQDLLPHLFAACHLLPLLRHDSGGYVLVGGAGGRYPWAGYGHCSIAAAALRMMARVLNDEAGRQGQRVQLLSIDAPVRAGATEEALALGRRALSMLEGASRGGAAIVDYAAPMTSQVIANAQPPAASSSPVPGRVAPAAAAAAAVPGRRDLRAARALLAAIASPMPPGSFQDEYC